MTGQQFYEGATVTDMAGEKIGTLHAYDPQGGYITVQKGFLFHKDLYIPVSAVQNTDAEGNVQLSLHKDDLTDERYDSPPAGGATRGMVDDDSYAQTATVADTTTTTRARQTTPAPAPRQAQATTRADDTINVPVFAEELIVGKRQEQIGDVRLHKDVVTEQATASVNLRHEEVTVERVPFTGQTSQADLQNAFQGQDIDMVVMGEEAVVGKQLRETEEVRLHKQATDEQEQVTDTVRKERVVVEGVDETRNTTTTGRDTSKRR
ncbi:MAG: YsnF/AvaK domain-containing protein [Chloroflexota bacterium]|nr:YsnF/AvaK domain-containing protein [Chloroflexota bacterium]